MDEKPSDALTKQPRRLRVLGLAAAGVIAVSGLGVGGYALAQGLTPVETTETAAPADEPSESPEPTDEPTPNTAPTADYYVMAISGLTVTVDAAPSADSDGEIVDYAWSFGDGGVASGVGATYAYSSYGSYAIVLTVTDDGGATGTFTAIVDVTAAPAPPTSGGSGGPAKCPAGSSAQENDGVNDVWCMWDYCANLTLPSAEHPECYPYFKP